jgi:hypothetical protein
VPICRCYYFINGKGQGERKEYWGVKRNIQWRSELQTALYICMELSQ